MKIGKCRVGKRCKFAHDSTPQTSSTSSPPTPTGIPEKKRICPFNSKRGGCWYGGRCKFDHSQQNEKSTKR
eukprot:11696646-Prorocentrum_lima.AAC.1